MIDAITAFLNGKDHVPPEDAIREKQSAARARLESARRVHKTACLHAETGEAGAVKARQAAREELGKAEESERSLSLALEEALAIAAKRKAEAEAAEVKRRWRLTHEHAAARQKAAEDIEKYVGCLRKAVVDFDKETKAMVAVCPQRLMPIRERAMATPRDMHGHLELRLKRLGVIGREPGLIEWGSTPIPEMVAKANECVASLDSEPQS